MFVYKEPDYMAKLGKAEEDNYITGDRMATFMLYLAEVSQCQDFNQKFICIHENQVLLALTQVRWRHYGNPDPSQPNIFDLFRFFGTRMWLERG